MFVKCTSFTEQSRNYCSFGRMIPPSGHRALRLRHVGTAEASLSIAVPAERASGLSRAQYEARELLWGAVWGVTVGVLVSGEEMRTLPLTSCSQPWFRGIVAARLREEALM